MDELLDDNLLNVAATAFHCVVERLLEVGFAAHDALSVTRRRHERLDYARETNLLRVFAQLLECSGVEVFSCAQTEFLCSEVANSLAVHRVVDGACARHYLYALLLEVEEALGAYRLNLRHDDVGAVLFNDSAQRFAVEHVEHLVLVCNLHSRCILISVACHDILSCTLCGDDKLLAQFTRTQ